MHRNREADFQKFGLTLSTGAVASAVILSRKSTGLRYTMLFPGNTGDKVLVHACDTRTKVSSCDPLQFVGHYSISSLLSLLRPR